MLLIVACFHSRYPAGMINPVIASSLYSHPGGGGGGILRYSTIKERDF